MEWIPTEYKTVGINKLLANASRDLVKYGICKTNLTGGRTEDTYYELRDYFMNGNPKLRYLTIPERKNNLAAQIAECMMVLSGNPELRQLSRFLPRAVNYSDDGLVWRGNYGTRIRGINAYPSPLNDTRLFPYVLWEDQLDKVINMLKVSPSSRQITITIHDSKIDTGHINTKDTPCTMDLVFGVVDGKLNLSVHMRSNDVIFGFTGVNYFIFTMVQELVASIVGLECGKYCHNAVSFHVYQNYYDRVQKYAEYADNYDNEVNLGPLFISEEGKGITLSEFDSMAVDFFGLLDLADNTSITKTEVFRSIVAYSDKWSDYGISDLTLIPLFYVHNLSRSSLLEMVGKDTQLGALIQRDSFLPKHTVE